MRLATTILFLLFTVTLQAGYFRGGDIHIQQHAPYSVQANIHINLLIHAEIDEITICWGDGSCEVLSATQTYNFPAIDTKTLHFFWIHQYSQHGFYEITVEACCWADDIFNMNLQGDQPIKLEAYFKLADPQTEAFNVMPLSLALPVVAGQLDAFLDYSSFVSIPDGDVASFEICAVDVQYYYLLDQIFPEPNNFIFDAVTGGFLWLDPPAPGYFIVKVCITTTRQGELMSETSRDILVGIDNVNSAEQLTGFDEFSPVCYPNPAQDALNLQYFLTENTVLEIALFDVSGKTAKTFRVEGHEGKNLETLDVSDLQNGFYSCKITSPDQSSALPFIKK